MSLGPGGAGPGGAGPGGAGPGGAPGVPEGYLVCRYCRSVHPPAGPSCPSCGAALDVRTAVSRSGWLKQPPIRDLARLQIGRSRLQIEGTRVPVADFALVGEEWIYFSHHVLLWVDPGVRLTNTSLAGAWNRVLAGLPLVMLEARGPGRIALSDNHAGDLVALPLAPGQQVWTREHRFLTATGNVGYTWEQTGIWRRPRDALPARPVRRPVHGPGHARAGAAALPRQHVPARPGAGGVRPDPAGVAALPRPVGDGAPAPGVPGGRPAVLVAGLVQPAHDLAAARGARPDRRHLGVRAHEQRAGDGPVARDDATVVTARDTPGARHPDR